MCERHLPPAVDRIASSYAGWLGEWHLPVPGAEHDPWFWRRNGRLSRFLLNWECESTGMQAIVVPLEYRLKLARALHGVIFKSEIETFIEALKDAHAATATLLNQFAT